MPVRGRFPPAPRAVPRALAAVLCVVVGVASCGRPPGDGPVVLAASSLAGPLTELARRPGGAARLSFAASSAAVLAVAEGSPADVVVTADPALLGTISGHLEGPVVLFATNHLVLATRAGNPAGLTGVPDLARAELRIGVCAPQVPCGALAGRVLEELGVPAEIDTFEPDARALRTKLADGELDLALVYASDVVVDPGLEILADPVPGLTTTYAAATVAPATPEATRWVEHLLEPTAQRVLAEHGFGPPPEAGP